MSKSWKQLVEEAEALGPLPDTSFEEYERRAAAIRQQKRPRVPAHAKVEKVSFPGDGRVELRVVVDCDDPSDAARYADGPAIDELIVNNVRLRNAGLRVWGERGPRKLEILLTGETEAARISMLSSFPLSLRVRGANDLQIDGFELGELK
ncbi:MAG: hypothetical protein QM820_20765 [Minicystis sp.]